MTPRPQHYRDHTRPEPRDDAINYQLGARERITIRPLTPTEIRAARLTCAEHDALDVLDALGIGRRLDVITEPYPRAGERA